MQYARGANKMLWQLMRVRDGRQFVIEYTGERQQIVALVLQRDALLRKSVLRQ
jgi:hypothetical protein